MQIIPLTSIERRQGGFTHKFVVTSDDLTATATATGQVLTLFTLAIGMLVARAAFKLKTAFKDSADSASILTPASLGDSGSAARFVASVELNENGTEITYKEGTGTLKAYTAADTLLLTVGATTTGKTLAALDTGELHVFVEIVDLTQL